MDQKEAGSWEGEALFAGCLARMVPKWMGPLRERSYTGQWRHAAELVM